MSKALTFVFVASGMGARVSGGDVISITLARQLSQRGHRVVIATSAAGKRSFQAADVHAEFWVFDRSNAEPRTLLGTAFHLLRRTFKAATLLRSKYLLAPTVVSPSSDMLNDVLAAALVRGTNLRRVALLHMVIPSPFKGYLGAFSSKRPRYGLDMRCALNWIQQRASTIVMRRSCDLVIPLSPYTREFLRSKLPRDRMAPFELALGVDCESADTADVADKVYDACWIGRFHPQKGCADLLKAWQLVCRQEPQGKLAVVGDIKEQMMPLVSELGLEDNVTFLGYLTGAEKFRALQQSKLLLFPSYFEGRPVAIAEAMVCGVPVVAYDLPVYRGCYPGGMVTAPVGDVEELASCALRLLRDDKLHTRLAREARQAASIYDWDRSVSSFVEAADLAFAAPPGNKTGE
jgi:glycosyltransferase involved in cell wall biosynthesis